MFIYSLANELKKTVRELCDSMTLEEMIGWAAYHKIKNEEQEREMNKVRSK